MHRQCFRYIYKRKDGNFKGHRIAVSKSAMNGIQIWVSLPEKSLSFLNEKCIIS